MFDWPWDACAHSHLIDRSHNFANGHRRPQRGDTILIQKKTSDTIDGVGIACTDPIGGEFRGLVATKDHYRVLPLLPPTNTPLRGRLTSTEAFYWRAGGGICMRGEVEVFQASRLGGWITRPFT